MALKFLDYVILYYNSLKIKKLKKYHKYFYYEYNGQYKKNYHLDYIYNIYNYYQKEYNNLVFDNNSDEYMFLKKIQNKNYSIEIFNHITYDLNDL